MKFSAGTQKMVNTANLLNAILNVIKFVFGCDFGASRSIRALPIEVKQIPQNFGVPVFGTEIPFVILGNPQQDPQPKAST